MGLLFNRLALGTDFLWVYTLTPIGQGGVAAAATYFYQLIQEGEGGVKEIHIIFGRVAFENRC